MHTDRAAETKELSRDMGEGKDATREHTRVSTHTCQPCEEAMGTYWIQGRGGMDRAKFGGQSKSATRRIAWSDGEVWMRQREVSVGFVGGCVGRLGWTGRLV